MDTGAPAWAVPFALLILRGVLGGGGVGSCDDDEDEDDAGKERRAVTLAKVAGLILISACPALRPADRISALLCESSQRTCASHLFSVSVSSQRWCISVA